MSAVENKENNKEEVKAVEDREIKKATARKTGNKKAAAYTRKTDLVEVAQEIEMSE
jgi:hypothetical protein